MGKATSDFERMNGVYQGFLTNLWDVVRELGLPFDVIYRLATDSGRATIKKMVEVAEADWLADNVKTDEHYSALISYRPVPSFDELNGKIFDWASPLYVDNEWQLHRSCAGIDTRPSEVRFLLRRLLRSTDCEEAIADRPEGYRPAIPAEAIEFGQHFPELHRRRRIVALGACVKKGNFQFVAVLHGDGTSRALTDRSFHREMHVGTCVLFVRDDRILHAV